MKFAVGLFLGIGIASAVGQSLHFDPSKDSGGYTIKVDRQAKVYATLDDEELAKIKEACK